MLFFILISLAVIKTEAREHVDLIEFNHFHDCTGRHVYDQVIFYEWAPDYARYHVRAWCLVEERDLVNRRPTKRYSDNLYQVQWHDRDQKLLRIITGTHYRESWTQVDPERANQRLLPEIERTRLTKQRPPQPIPDDAPMLEATDGE